MKNSQKGNTLPSVKVLQKKYHQAHAGVYVKQNGANESIRETEKNREARHLEGFILCGGAVTPKRLILSWKERGGVRSGFPEIPEKTASWTQVTCASRPFGGTRNV